MSDRAGDWRPVFRICRLVFAKALTIRGQSFVPDCNNRVSTGYEQPAFRISLALMVKALTIRIQSFAPYLQQRC